MPPRRSADFLRYILWADAISCLVCGLLQTACNEALGQWLGLPKNLLVDSGAFLLLYAVAVACLVIRFRFPPPSKIIWLLIAGNVIWAVGCADIAFVAESTRLGKAYVVAQALMVASLALLQYSGVRQARDPAYV
jgi:hypothetical protein